MGGYVAQSAPNVDKPNAEKAPLSPTKALDIHLQKTEAPPPIVDSPSPEKANDLRHDSSKGSSFTAAAQPAEKPSHSILLKAARGSLHNRPELQRPTNQTVRFAASVNSRPLKKPKLEAAASPPSVPPPLEVKMPQSANLVPTRPAEPRSDEPEDKAKQPVTAAQMTGEVSVVTDPYPSLRADERDSKKQKHGASLELGHLLSRVVPVYPEEAKRQGIQGTVKLHAVVDRYGSVKSMQPVSGPAILGAAVVNAVRQWQYTETKLAGQPVETEVDVAVVFRLSNSATPKS
jgi:protein TonB